MKISVVDPISFAFEHMANMLFKPFDLGKWLVIGFAAFLTQCGELGGGPNLNCSNPFSGTGGPGGGGGGMPSPFAGGVDWMLVATVIAGVLIVILLLAGLLWLGTRGQFVLMHCIANDEAAITEPWSQYGRPADSLFLVRLALMFATWLWVGCVLGLLALLFWADIDAGDDAAFGMAIGIGALLIIPVWLLSAFFGMLLKYILAPVMLSKEMTVREAWPITRDTIIKPTFWPMMGLFGMQILLAIGMGVFAQIVACVTCLIGALPYVSAVLLLPAIILMTAYPMRFVEQYGFMIFNKHESLDVCPSCSYDLRGNPDATNCPECGFDITKVRKICPTCAADLSKHPKVVQCPECEHDLVASPAITQEQAQLRAQWAQQQGGAGAAGAAATAATGAPSAASAPTYHAGDKPMDVTQPETIDLEEGDDEPTFRLDDDDESNGDVEDDLDLDLDLDLPPDNPNPPFDPESEKRR